MRFFRSAFIDASTANCTITADTVRWSGDSIVSPYRLLRLDDSSGSFAHCIFGQSAPVGCDRLTVYLPGNSHSVEFVDCTFITHTDAQYLGSRIWETSYGMPTRLSRNRVGNQDGTQQGMLPEMRVLALNGAQPYVFSPGVYTMTNGSATTVTDFLTDGTVGREHLLGWEVTILLGSNTTFANTGNLRLAGGTSWTATNGSVLTLIFDGTNWREKTRMTA